MADLGKTQIYGNLDLKNNELRQVKKINEINASEIETVSGAQQKVDIHISDQNNPHGVSKTDVGLGSVDNYSRAHYDGRYLRNDSRNKITVTSSTSEPLLNLDATNNAGSNATLLEGSIGSNTTDRYFMTFKGTSDAINWQVSTDGVLRQGNIPWGRLSSIPSTALSDTTYSAGTGLSLSGTTFNIDSVFNPSGSYSGLRAQATTKDDVGLGSVGNYSRAHYDGRYASSDHTHSEYATGDNFNSTGTYSGLRAQATTSSDVNIISSTGSATHPATYPPGVTTFRVNDSSYPNQYGDLLNVYTSSNYAFQLFGSRTSGNHLYYRASTGTSSVTAWHTVYTTGNKPSKADVGLSNVDNYSRAHYDGRYAASSHTHSGHDVKVLGNRISVDNDGKIRANNSSYRQAGMYGTYSSSRIGHVWSMGNSYTIDSNGADFGNLYGIAYKHTNNSTGGTMAGGHQIVFVNNGSSGVAIGFSGNIWASGSIGVGRTPTSNMAIDADNKIRVVNSNAWNHLDLYRTASARAEFTPSTRNNGALYVRLGGTNDRDFIFSTVESWNHRLIEMGNITLKGLNSTLTRFDVRNSTDSAFADMQCANIDTEEINASGDIYTGSMRFWGNTIENESQRLYLTGNAGHGGVRLADNTGEGTNFYITTGRIWSTDLYDRTYSGSANMYLTSAGTLGRSTSAKRYKLNIKEEHDEDWFEKILNLQVKSWHDKDTVERNAEYLTNKSSGIKNQEEEEEEDLRYIERHYGLIAEDLVEAGLNEFVTYGQSDEKGNRQVEGIEYDRVWVLLIPIIKEQQKRITELEEIIGNIK